MSSRFVGFITNFHLTRSCLAARKLRGWSGVTGEVGLSFHPEGLEYAKASLLESDPIAIFERYNP